jgi:hypothetical protein
MPKLKKKHRNGQQGEEEWKALAERSVLRRRSEFEDGATINEHNPALWHVVEDVFHSVIKDRIYNCMKGKAEKGYKQSDIAKFKLIRNKIDTVLRKLSESIYS